MGGSNPVSNTLDKIGSGLSDLGSSIDDAIVQPSVNAIKDVGSDVDDFVNEEIPGGWYTVGAVAGGTYLANAGAAAGTAGAAEGAAAAGIPQASGAIVYPVAAPAAIVETPILAGTVGIPAATGALTGSEGLLSATEAVQSNIDPAFLENTSYEQLTQAAVDSPYYAAAQSNIDPAFLEAATAESVANAPVLTSAVLPETLAVPASMGLKDAVNAVRTANSLRNLLGQPTAQIPPMQRQMIQPQGSVQYPSLSLLEMRPIQRPTTLI